MIKLIAVMAGGSVGAALRFGVSLLASKSFSGNFPWGTFLVNIIGSFLIGLLWPILDRHGISAPMKLFILTGCLGAFTTFSTYSLETLQLLRTGDIKTAAIYVLASNITGLLLVFGGYSLSRTLAGNG